MKLNDFVDLLWEEESINTAVNVVRRYLGTLRRTFEPELPAHSAGRWLARQSHGYRSRCDATNLDLMRFRDLSARAMDASAGQRPMDALALFVDALDVVKDVRAPNLRGDVTSPSLSAIDLECAGIARFATDLAVRQGVVEPILPSVRRTP